MAPDRVQGYPDYTQAGNFKNIPKIYSQKYQLKFYNVSPIPMMTNSDFSADAKKMGDEVIIQARPTITIKKYLVGGNMEMENPTAPAISFPMNRSNYFYFGLDKVTMFQMLNDQKFMDECSQDAGEQMDTAIAAEFLGDVVDYAHSDNIGASAGVISDLNMGTTGSFPTITAANVLKYIAACEVIGDEQNWPSEGRYICLPSIFKAVLQTSNIADAAYIGDGKQSVIVHGKITKVGAMNVLISNQIKRTTDSNKTVFSIPFGHMSGIGFASNIIETAYFDQFERTSGKAIRVVNLYDWKVVNPKALGVLYAAVDLGLT